MKFLITDWAPNLADPDLCTEIDDDFVSDADDAVEKYAEDDDWSDGYDPRTVYVLCVETGITSEHEITVEFDPIFSSAPVRHGPVRLSTWCKKCDGMHGLSGVEGALVVEAAAPEGCAGELVRWGHRESIR